MAATQERTAHARPSSLVKHSPASRPIHDADTLNAMLDLVARNLDRIQAVCRRHGVSSLDLVGSAAREDFDRARSDIDVLVDFPDGAADLFGSFMDLREDLASILGRPVDVITARGVRNPLLLDSLRQGAIRLYAA